MFNTMKEMEIAEAILLHNISQINNIDIKNKLKSELSFLRIVMDIHRNMK